MPQNSGAERQLIIENTSGQNVFSMRRNSAQHGIRVPFACLRSFWTHMRAASISCSHVWRPGVHSALRNQRCMHEHDKTKQVTECMQAHILCYHTFTWLKTRQERDKVFLFKPRNGTALDCVTASNHVVAKCVTHWMRLKPGSRPE